MNHKILEIKFIFYKLHNLNKLCNFYLFVLIKLIIENGFTKYCNISSRVNSMYLYNW